MSQHGKISVLEMIDDASMGGGQVHVLLLAKHLDPDRFDVSIACAPQGYLVDEARKIGINVLPVTMDNRLRLKSFRDVRAVLRAKDFDILHTHGGTAGFWGRIGASMLGTPPVRFHTYHGIHYLGSTDPSKRVFHFLERNLLRRTERIVLVCKADFRKALEAGIASEDKGVIVYYGIETESFRASQRGADVRRQFGVKEDDLLVGNVGRLHIQKGQRYLLEAFRDLRREFPNANLWIVGDGELSGELHGLSNALGIGSAVRFLGTRTDIPDLLSAMDVFVLSSLWEGQPISLLEAMVAGKAIVATDVDGIPEIIADGENGLLVPSKNPAALASALSRMLRDGSFRQRLSRSAAGTIGEKFTAKKMAEEMGRHYREALEPRSGGAPASL